MIGEFIKNIFGDNVILATILMSMIPLIELKGAIPFGVSAKIWGANALSTWQAYLWSIVGGIITTTLLVFLFKPIYEALKDKKFFKTIIDFFTSDVNKKANKINNKEHSEEAQLKQERRHLINRIITTIIFVAIPVPGTGVYTGTALAVLIKLNIWQVIVFVTIGNIIAGLIVTTVCSIFPAITDIILVVFVAAVFVYLLCKAIIKLSNKNKNEIKE